MNKLSLYICKLVLFCIPIGIFYIVKSSYMLSNDKYMQEVHGHEVYTSIKKSKEKTKIKKLIIGDSTANQLYNTETDTTSSIYSLTCNQAIGIVGHFFLLNNYLKAGNHPEDVYMIYSPLGFWDNLDQIYTYHYFLKPFYNEEYKPLMTENVFKQIHKIPFYYLCQNPIILTSDWSPELTAEKRDYTFFSPISKEYLEKIASLSKEYSFNLHIIPPFISEYWYETINSFNINEIKGRLFFKDIKSYLKKINYINDSYFSDHLHLKHDHLGYFKNKMDSTIHATQ